MSSFESAFILAHVKFSGKGFNSFVNLPESGVVAPTVTLLIDPEVVGLIVTVPLGDSVALIVADKLLNVPFAGKIPPIAGGLPNRFVIPVPDTVSFP